MTADIQALNSEVKKSGERFDAAKQEIARIVVGQKEMINSLFVALLANGHVLLEGLPGLAKTLAVNTLARTLHCDFKRIQFTPDLLPADLIGTTIYNYKEGTFTVNKGSIFTQILLADEINRAPAKVQSALLEVMQERQVTLAGTTYAVGSPYLVLATQNPIEQEGTYPLPEAQTDRFMLKVKVEYPSRQEEREILQRMGTLTKIEPPTACLSAEEVLEARAVVDAIYIDDKLIDYILNIIHATRNPESFRIDMQGMLLYGASPRATIALKLASKAHAFLAGRSYVTPHDIKSIGKEVLRHRLRRSYAAEAEGITADDLIDKIFGAIPVP